MKKITIQMIYHELARLDPNLKIGDESFKAAVVLLSAAAIGNDVGQLARFTGLPRALISKFGKRLKANGLWKDGYTCCEWFDDNGGLAFFMDVNVALGFMNRGKKAA